MSFLHFLSISKKGICPAGLTPLPRLQVQSIPGRMGGKVVASSTEVLSKMETTCGNDRPKRRCPKTRASGWFINDFN